MRRVSFDATKDTGFALVVVVIGLVVVVCVIEEEGAAVVLAVVEDTEESTDAIASAASPPTWISNRFPPNSQSLLAATSTPLTASRITTVVDNAFQTVCVDFR